MDEIVAAGREALEHEAELLADRLAEVELAHATLQAELTAFHADYMREVGSVMVQVHDLNARILRIVARRSGVPADAAAADSAEAQARETTAHMRAVPVAGPLPTPDLKKLFREAAKRMHPDLARDEEARGHAQAFMRRLNDAYRAGDAAAIEDLLRQWDRSPSGAPPRGAARVEVAAREVTALRAALAQARARLQDAESSQMGQLLERAMARSATGGDLLAEMRRQALAELERARARLRAVEP